MYPNAPDTNAIANAIKSIQQGMPQALLSFCLTPVIASPSPQAVTPVSMDGIVVGSMLNIDVSNPESVVVTATTPTTFTAIFTKNHGHPTQLQWTIGTGSLSYSLVKIGAVQDPTDLPTYCSIFFELGESRRFAQSGWRIEDRPTFLIESGFDYVDSSAAEQALMRVRDVLLPIYFAQVSLNATPGVFLTQPSGEPDRALFKEYPNGRVYRVHHLLLQVHAQYNIPVAG